MPDDYGSLTKGKENEPEPIEPLRGRTFSADNIRLFADSEHTEICALIGQDPVSGIAGFGPSVHEALRDLADALVREGVWVEVPEEIEPGEAGVE